MYLEHPGEGITRGKYAARAEVVRGVATWWGMGMAPMDRGEKRGRKTGLGEKGKSGGLGQVGTIRML